jgi:hypothetical protein
VRDDRFQREPSVEAPPVWHVLKLSNGGDAPWTTAPILILGDLGPLAQSDLTYTPAGGEAVVRLTQALDIVGRAHEVRSDDARSGRESVNLFGHRYELVTVRGQLELTNRSRRSVPMHVVKEIRGDVLDAQGAPRIDARAAGLDQVNASRTVTWDFELDAGAEWKVDYLYEVLIRR